MAFGEVSSISDDLFQCAVCFYEYDNEKRKAKLLPCHHTFCSECLDSLIVSALLKCPLCGEVSCVTNVNTLKSNHYLSQFSDVIKRMNSLSSGYSSPEQSMDPTDKFCNKHGNAEKFFWCWTCSCTICVNCTALDHSIGKGHEVCNVSEASDKLRRKILNTLSTVNGAIASLRNKQAAAAALRNATAERAIGAIRNVTSSPAAAVAKMVTEATLDPKRYSERYAAAAPFLDQHVAKLNRSHDELREINSYFTNMENYVDQKLTEARVQKQSDVVVGFLHPGTRFDYGRMYCMRCGKMCQNPEPLPPGKSNPYGVPVVLNYCPDCSITVLKISDS